MLHRIETGDSPPIRTRGYRHTPADNEEINSQAREMLAAGVIEESDTAWGSPVILVSKKEFAGVSSKRFVVDFHKLNAVTKLTSFPLPTIETVLDTVAEQKPLLWTSLDLRSGYWQTCLNPETADRTGFSTQEGRFRFKRVPFGLCGAFQFFQQVMHKVLRGLTPSSVLVYLDDILVWGKTPDDMIQKLDLVFQRFRAANLRLHPAKCHWSADRVRFLGHVFDRNGISLDESKLSIVRDFPRPRTPKHIKRFLGLCNYYRRFEKSFSQISAPMRALLKGTCDLNGRTNVRRLSRS